MPVDLWGRCKSVDWNKMGPSSFIMFHLFWIATFMIVWLCCCEKRWTESQSASGYRSVVPVRASAQRSVIWSLLDWCVMTCSRCHRLVGITCGECFEPCVVTSVYCDCERLVNDEGKKIALRTQVCYSAVSYCWLRTRVGFHSWCVCSKRQTQGGAFQAGFCCIIFSGIFFLVP